MYIVCKGECMYKLTAKCDQRREKTGREERSLQKNVLSHLYDHTAVYYKIGGGGAAISSPR